MAGKHNACMNARQPNISQLYWLASRDSSDEKIAGINLLVLDHPSRNETWKLFGYNKKPWLGGIPSWFRPKWKREYEEGLYEELHILTYAILLDCKVIDLVTLRQAIEAFFNDSEGIPLILFGFESRSYASRNWYSVVCHYHRRPKEAWATTLHTRLEAEQFPDKAVSTRLLTGAIAWIAYTACEIRREIAVNAAMRSPPDHR